MGFLFLLPIKIVTRGRLRFDLRFISFLDVTAAITAGALIVKYLQYASI